MEPTIEKDCNALDGLFQAIVNDMKVSIEGGKVGYSLGLYLEAWGKRGGRHDITPPERP